MASKKVRRTLSEDDRRLWSRVAETTNPLKRSAKPILTTETPAPVAKPNEAKKTQKFRIGERTQTPAGSEQALATHGVTPRMDAKAFGKLKRGKLKPEARIDLHGMTAAQAHGALLAFVLQAQAGGLRLVLVITGKGRSQGDGGLLVESPGVLRRQVPHWLETPPLAQSVLQVAEAHQRHGGSGAYYVYLRRRQ